MTDVATSPERNGGGALLAVEGLRIELERRAQPPVPIARDVSLRVDEGEIVGLIGESGSGKTMTAKSLIGLLPERIHVAAGRAVFRSRDLLALDEIFGRPRHPYTRALVGAAPRLLGNPERLSTIPGRIPQPSEEITGCRFRIRCPLAESRCIEPPSLRAVAEGHDTRCWLA